MMLEMEFSLLDGGNDDKHNGVGLAEVSKIFVMNDDLFDKAAPFDRIYKKWITNC